MVLVKALQSVTYNAEVRSAGESFLAPADLAATLAKRGLVEIAGEIAEVAEREGNKGENTDKTPGQPIATSTGIDYSTVEKAVEKALAGENTNVNFIKRKLLDGYAEKLGVPVVEKKTDLFNAIVEAVKARD